MFGKLFRKKKLTITDEYFGEIESFSIRGNHVNWKINWTLFGYQIEILLEGTPEGISANHKDIITKTLSIQEEIKLESENALREEYANAEIEFTSIHELFTIQSMTVEDNGFYLSFQEKQSPFYLFNVHFRDNKADGVSVDG